MGSFLKRFFSGAWLVALLAVGLVVGGWVLLALLLITSLTGVRELYQAVGTKRETIPSSRYDALALCGYISTVLLYAVIGLKLGYMWILLTIFVCVLMSMTVYVVKYPAYEPIDIMSTIFGVVYIPLMLATIYLLRQSSFGEWKVWMVFICSWVCDTCAYCVGSLIGKHKMAPVLSPKKSIEGAVGGVVGSILASGLFAVAFYNLAGKDAVFTGDVVKSLPVLVIIYMLAAFFGSVFSQIGDLCASAIKRHYAIKDYGTIIPGHGGVLDRFDSSIVTAPMIFIFMSIIG